MKTRLVIIVETDPDRHTNPWEWDWSDLLLTKAYVDSYDVLKRDKKNERENNGGAGASPETGS
jgi:hypothetical protein